MLLSSWYFSNPFLQHSLLTYIYGLYLDIWNMIFDVGRQTGGMAKIEMERKSIEGGHKTRLEVEIL